MPISLSLSHSHCGSAGGRFRHIKQRAARAAAAKGAAGAAGERRHQVLDKRLQGLLRRERQAVVGAQPHASSSRVRQWRTRALTSARVPLLPFLEAVPHERRAAGELRLRGRRQRECPDNGIP